MEEAGFPRPAATTATLATTATPATTAMTATIVPIEAPVIIPSPTEQNEVLVRFDPEYLMTVPGIVKIVQISLSLLGFICIQVSVERSSRIGKYYSSTTGIAVAFSGTLLGLYLFHVVEKYQHKIPWLKIELAFCGMWTIFILVGSAWCVGMWSNYPFMAAGQIGLRTTVAYGIDFYLKWGGVLRGHLAQTKRVEYQYPAAADVPVVSTVRLSAIQQC